MKKLLVMTMLLVCGMTTAFAQKPAEIKFDKLTHNFGTFSEKNPVVSCVFTYTNVGEQNLVINQAIDYSFWNDNVSIFVYTYIASFT